MFRNSHLMFAMVGTGAESLVAKALPPRGSEKSLRRYVHGDVSFEASEASPCRRAGGQPAGRRAEGNGS